MLGPVVRPVVRPLFLARFVPGFMAGLFRPWFRPRRLGRLGLRRLQGGDMLVIFTVRRAAVAMLAIAASAAIPATASAPILVTVRAVFLAHFDVHHLAASEFLAGDLLDRL